MNSMIAQWEDEENNRHIQFSVDYSIESNNVEIVNVTPRQVDFTCDDKTSVGVHTVKGKSLLASKIVDSGCLERVKSEIAHKEGIVAAV